MGCRWPYPMTVLWGVTESAPRPRLGRMSQPWRRPRRLIRTALGPGVQAYGPTEQLLHLVSCDLQPSDSYSNRYCEQRAHDARLEMQDRQLMRARER
jgi:hypothetical protein